MTPPQNILDHTVPLGLVVTVVIAIVGFAAFIVWRFAGLSNRIGNLSGKIKVQGEEVDDVKTEVKELRQQTQILQALVVQVANTNEKLERMQVNIDSFGTRFDEFLNMCIDKDVFSRSRRSTDKEE